MWQQQRHTSLTSFANLSPARLATAWQGPPCDCTTHLLPLILNPGSSSSSSYSPPSPSPSSRMCLLLLLLFSRAKHHPSDPSAWDIVLIPVNRLSSEFSQMDSPLLRVHWQRIILVGRCRLTLSNPR